MDQRPAYLPGCSAGDPPKKQIVSNAMMQAYVQMRGPSLGNGGADDPLFEWFRTRENHDPSEASPDHRRDISRMLRMIDKYLEPNNMAGDSPRDAIFEINRPSEVQHIHPPEDMDLSTHALTASRAEFEFDLDEDDDECGVPTGRISPCTFLEWSRGCSRWSQHDMKKSAANAFDTPKTSHRAAHRGKQCWSRQERRQSGPATPSQGNLAQDYYRSAVPQFDEISGDSLSPYYKVPSSPSIIYTPPGIPNNVVPPVNFQVQYSRMNPVAALKLRELRYGLPGKNVETTGTDEHYSFSEAESVARSLEPVDTNVLAGTELTDHLASRWTYVTRNRKLEDTLYRSSLEQQERIRNLQLDLETLRLYVPLLTQQRERERELEEERMRQELIAREARRERIREHMALHVRDAQYQLDLGALQLAMQRCSNEENEQRLDSLSQRVEELCMSVGKKDVRGVIAEVHGLSTEDEESGEPHQNAHADEEEDEGIITSRHMSSEYRRLLLRPPTEVRGDRRPATLNGQIVAANDQQAYLPRQRNRKDKSTPEEVSDSVFQVQDDGRNDEHQTEATRHHEDVLAIRDAPAISETPFSAMSYGHRRKRRHGWRAPSLI